MSESLISSFLVSNVSNCSGPSPKMSESLIFLSELLIRSFLGKELSDSFFLMSEFPALKNSKISRYIATLMKPVICQSLTHQKICLWAWNFRTFQREWRLKSSLRPWGNGKDGRGLGLGTLLSGVLIFQLN